MTLTQSHQMKEFLEAAVLRSQKLTFGIVSGASGLCQEVGSRTLRLVSA